MIISNFSVTPNQVAPGETMHVQLTITIEAGDKVNGLSFYGGPEHRLLYNDSNFNPSVGQSRQISFDSVVPTTNQYINDSLAASKTQSFTVPYWYIVLGGFGTRVDIPNPVTYVDRGLYPAINAFTLERADGIFPSDEGENVLATIKLSVGNFANTTVAYLRLYYQAGSEPTSTSNYIDLSSYIPTLVRGVADDSTIITRTFSNSENWVFKLAFGDADESTELVCVLPRSFANVHLSGDEQGGVCFGGFSRGMGKLESYYPASFYAGIEGVTNYSAGEVKTGGTWIDGKPIYRAVIVGNSTGNTGSDVEIGSLSSKPETIFRMYGTILRDNGVWLNFDTSDFYGINSYLFVDMFGGVYLRTGNVGTITVIIEYTKTTD